MEHHKAFLREEADAMPLGQRNREIGYEFESPHDHSYGLAGNFT